MKSNNLHGGFATLVSGVSALALSTGIAAAQSVAEDAIAEIESTGQYLSGDKHNHTTCTDGSTSVQVLVNESLLNYELDWFAQTGHGGEGPRDCRFTDFEYDGAGSGEGLFWEQTIGADAIRGDVETTTGFGAGTFADARQQLETPGEAREMWRWQMLIEFAGPLQRAMGEIADKPAWVGVESNVPGHEHVSMAIVEDQLTRVASFYSTGQFEYLWDRSDDDTSGGEDFDFENPANNGVAKQVDVTDGDAGHQRSVESVEWLSDFFPVTSYYVPAHVERQGGFDPNGARGYNVEHFRDYHNAGLLNQNRPDGQSLAFGAEMIAGHQSPRGGRGTYELDRPSAGFGTYGGAGAYGAAEVTVPGFNFDGGDGTITTGTTAPTPIVLPTNGRPISDRQLANIAAAFDANFDGRLTEPSGADQFDSLVTDIAKERYVFGRPGLATMWDALLGEGRRFFNFGSSDWHNRGEFGPFEPQSTLDFFPGEYQRIYAFAPGDEFTFNQRDVNRIVAGLRTGNSYSVMGDLVDEFFFVMCQEDRCATMGETLRVTQFRGDVTFRIELRDPEGINRSPYTFNNPSLAQVNLAVPMNAPVLSHIDILKGDISGFIEPEDDAYTTRVANPTVEILATFDNFANEFTVEGDRLVVTGSIPATEFTNDMYFRVRGTNIPKGTPNETDADGNPLLDDFSALIPCEVNDPEPDGTFRGEFCPEHLPVDANGTKFLDADVEAWADLWLYSNPIFIVTPDGPDVDGDGVGDGGDGDSEED